MGKEIQREEKELKRLIAFLVLMNTFVWFNVGITSAQVSSDTRPRIFDPTLYEFTFTQSPQDTAQSMIFTSSSGNPFECYHLDVYCYPSDADLSFTVRLFPNGEDSVSVTIKHDLYNAQLDMVTIYPFDFPNGPKLDSLKVYMGTDIATAVFYGWARK